MIALVIGLLLFLGSHSVRFLADDWRSRQVERFGLRVWKLGYSVVSLIGLVLIIWGVGLTQTSGPFFWVLPYSAFPIISAIMLLAIIFVVAAYSPRNIFKAYLHHPLIAGVGLWAFAHLVASGRVASMLLFASFLLWAIAAFIYARRRDQRQEKQYASGLMGTVISIVLGFLVWAAFITQLHTRLIGIPLIM